MTVFSGSFVNTDSLRFAIVVARYNDLIVGKLLQGCQDSLLRHGVDVSETGSQVDYAWVPGSLEVSMVAKELAVSGRYDAIICLGAVIRGDTPHFDYVASEVSKGVAAASYQTGVPIIFGILTTDTMQQALERAGIKSNKGWEFGMGAIEMANLMRQIRSSPYAEFTKTLTPSSSPAGDANKKITGVFSPSLAEEGVEG